MLQQDELIAEEEQIMIEMAPGYDPQAEEMIAADNAANAELIAAAEAAEAADAAEAAPSNAAAASSEGPTPTKVRKASCRRDWGREDSDGVGKKERKTSLKRHTMD